MIKANFNAYSSYVTDSVYQWDINRKLTVNGLNLAVAPEVHFSNANMDKAIVRQSTLLNHAVTVDIPNSLLQYPLTVKAHIGIYEGGAFKVVEVVEIPVIAKARPADYQIENSDEELYSFEALKNDIANMVKLSDFNRNNTAITARIDNIIAHNNDTDGNTELVDIRVGANGEYHDSAGSAVRSQIGKLNAELGPYMTLKDVDIALKSVNGYYNADLEYVELSYYHTCEPIACNKYDTFVANVTNVGNVAYKVALFDENKNIIAVDLLGTGSTTTFSELEYTVYQNAKYISFTVADTRYFYVKKKELLNVFADSQLYGKTLGGLGDSLMSSAYTGDGLEWLSLIGKRNNMTVYNYALSGNPIACISATDNNGQEVVGMSARYSTMANDLDFIVVMGGANDKNYSVPIGNNSDNTVYTFKGALNVLITGLINKYPTAKILFATNYCRFGDEEEKTYVDAMIEICKLHSIPCHNNYTSSGCHFNNEQWLNIYGADPNDHSNKHLNSLGDERVSYMYEQLLKAL